jgi:hypothetical protein
MLHFTTTDCVYLFLGRTMLARAATPSLWMALRLSQVVLRPSTTAINSWAMRCARLPLPLPTFLLFEALPMIHWRAARRRCLWPSGTGIWSATPPPAAPLWLRMRIRGATESMASVRYRTGLRGRCDGGGAPGRRGFAGLMVGMGDVRRCWRMRAMFCAGH